MTTALWIADQPGYVDEAELSARSFKRYHPHSEVVLYGRPNTARLWDRAYRLPERRHEHWYQDSVSYFFEALLKISDETVIYFDTDTYILDQLDGLLDLIGRFDLIGAHAPARETAPSVGGAPEAFCEINIGVLGLYNTSKVQHLFYAAEKLYAEHAAVYGNNDQAPLRDALWQNPAVKVYIMPPEYNCRFGFGGFAALPVKVLHGRGMPYEDAARLVNAARGMRAWTNQDLRERV